MSCAEYKLSISMNTDVSNMERNVPKFLDIVVIITDYGNTPSYVCGRRIQPSR
jgi:hypothetical protein